MNSEAERAWDSLLRTHGTLEGILDKHFSTETGLNLPSYYLLRALRDADIDLTMTELSDRLTSSRTRVSRRVDDLESDGLLGRKTNPRDGRSSLVALTDEGRATIARAVPVYQALIARRIGRIASTAQLRELTAILDSLGEAADSSDRADLP